MQNDIQMAFNFLDKDMMRKNKIFHDQIKTRICRSNMVPEKEKACVEIKKNIENCN